MNASKSTEFNSTIGGIEFFRHNLSAYLPYTCFSALATIFGALGKNLEIIFS